MYYFRLIIAAMLVLAWVGCGVEGSNSSYDPPASHTINRDGFMHASGSDPESECAACHGADLAGDTGPSCTECHGVKW